MSLWYSQRIMDNLAKKESKGRLCKKCGAPLNDNELAWCINCEQAWNDEQQIRQNIKRGNGR